MFKKQPTKEVIKQIHNSFNTAGDGLLVSALEVLNQVGQTTIEKAERLKRVGFTNANDVKKAESILVSKEIAELIQHYQVKYPNNKFITDEQVDAINKKYSLVCAPIDRYKGFVPEAKLKMVEDFRLHAEDKPLLFCTDIVFEFPHQKKEIRALKNKYPNNEFPIPKWGRIDDVWISRYSVVGGDEMYICAPSKDMDLKGLKKVGSVLASLTRVTVPDPVVLQPCRGGYLIVAAWGDEASDEVVVNQKHN